MARASEKIAKHALKSILKIKFHTDHARQAKGILSKIESKKGKLSSHLVSQCNEYASDVLGSKIYAPWLYVYSAIAGVFKEGWIPDNYYGGIVVPKVKGLYGDVSALKPLNGLIFNNDAFPDCLSYINNIFVDKEYNVVPRHAVKSMLFADTDKVVFKPDNSAQGLGILFFDSSDFDIDKMPSLGNGLFQSYIKQHPVFEMYAPQSVATLRMTTVSDDDGISSLRACYLRLGNGSDTHVKSQTHIRIPIDIENGKFHAHGYDTNWLELESHPTSGVSFKDQYVPNFRECKDLVKNLHRKIPYVRCVGWDVVVNASNQPAIMEWNGAHNDIKFSEATQGPCFADMGWQNLIK